MGILHRISGPVVDAKGVAGAKMYDVVKVGTERLTGEIIKMVGDTCTIQVYEETNGLRPGEAVETTGEPLSVELGPGLLTSIYDGIQRPLDVMAEKGGAFITRGLSANSLNREKKWEFVPVAKNGQQVKVGDVLGTVQETAVILHRIMAPFEGKVNGIVAGKFTVEEQVCSITNSAGKEQKVIMMQRWFVQERFPCSERLVGKYI